MTTTKKKRVPPQADGPGTNDERAEWTHGPGKGKENTMKTTIDTYTGKPFRWNDVVNYLGKNVPARVTKRRSTPLNPDRVPKKLLAQLNPPQKAAV